MAMKKVAKKSVAKSVALPKKADAKNTGKQYTKIANNLNARMSGKSWGANRKMGGK
jgi:hypothetical protein